MNTYEIFTMNFSKIVQASDVRNAIQKFQTMFRQTLEITAITDIRYFKKFEEKTMEEAINAANESVREFFDEGISPLYASAQALEEEGEGDPCDDCPVQGICEDTEEEELSPVNPFAMLHDLIDAAMELDGLAELDEITEQDFSPMTEKEIDDFKYSDPDAFRFISNHTNPFSYLNYFGL